MKQANKKNSGFTLMEMLISITIFMMFLGIIASSYTSLTGANRRANETQKLYREIRFVFDTLAQEIRAGTIDYSCIDPSEKTLCIVDGKGQKRAMINFNEAEKSITLANQVQAGVLSSWSTEQSQSLTSETFGLEDLEIKVYPLQDPYKSGNESINEIQVQPSVELILKARGYVFRTVYSSRVYGSQTLYAGL